MSFFDAKTKTISIDDENSYTIKKITYGERQTILENSMKVSGSTTGESGFSINVAKLKIETLCVGLVNWEGPEFDKPLLKENILNLPNWLAEQMTEEIDSFNAELTEDEKKD